LRYHRETSIKYVRYEDNFLLGILSYKELVKKIRDKIATLVNSDLKINVKRVKITHIGMRKLKNRFWLQGSKLY